MKIYKIRKSVIDKKGRGLYATRDIKEGTKIIDYIGKLITKKQTEYSDKYDNGKPIYLFTINKKYDLDGDFPWNTAGLINHSCNNNCDYDGKGIKIADEYEEVTESNARIEGDTFNDPYYTDGIQVDDIIKEVDDTTPSIKKASGGIARMLGE